MVLVMGLSDILLVSLVGGLMALDRTAAFQFMISRPIVAGPVIGLTLGEPAAGVAMGALIELVWISRLPLGGKVPPNESLGAIVGTAAVIIAAPRGEPPGRELLALGFLCVPPVAHLAALLETRLRRLNALLAARARKAVKTGRPDRLNRLNLAGLALSLAGIYLYIMSALLLIVPLLAALRPRLPESLRTALEITYFCLPLLGVAAALSNMNVKRADLVFALFFGGVFLFLSL
ncbi:MAG: PTS sugar transporter subunit IIC [Thermodesulfobacteriota bacterium]